MVGLAFCTAALIVVLSVFNGLGDLLRSLYTSFDPEIKIEAAKGKSFEVSPEFLQQLNSIEGIEIITEVIEDYAYVRYRDADLVATIKGVSNNFLDQHRLDNHITDGKLVLQQDGTDFAIVGRGVQYALSIAVQENFYPLQIFYIKKLKGASLDPASLYSRKLIQPGGVFSIEKNFDDNYIFLPLEFTRDLLDYGNKRTALEIKTADGANVITVQKELKKLLGENFSVLTNEEQHKDVHRLIKFEKLFTFIAFVILIIVASINIFFSLMMLVIEKKKDISILSSFGASESLIQKVFLTEGALIAFIGAASGLVLGALLCWLQDTVGLVGMGMENSVISHYPVKMICSDFLYVSSTIIVITLGLSYYPARLAARSFTLQDL